MTHDKQTWNTEIFVMAINQLVKDFFTSQADREKFDRLRLGSDGELERRGQGIGSSGIYVT